MKSQQEDERRDLGRAGYLTIIIRLVLALLLAPPAAAVAQPAGGGAGAAGPGFGEAGPGVFPGFGGPLELLARDDVRKELELLDDQVRELQGLRDRMRERMREMVTQRMRKGPAGGEGTAESQRAEFRESIRKMMEQINAEIRQEAALILLPHQMKRLDQLALQLRMRGGLNALGGDVAQQLGVTDRQREELRVKSEEVEREFRRKVAELRRQAHDQLLTVLTPEQQARLKELLGEPFEFSEPPRRPGEGPGDR